MKSPTRVQSATLEDIFDRLLARAAREKAPSFRTLVKVAGLDPTRDFVGASLRNVDFRREDLRGFDFSKADLSGSDFRRSKVDGVHFDQAILTGAIGLPNAIRAVVRDSGSAQNIATIQNELKDALRDWDDEEIDHHIKRFRPSYWLNVSLRDMVRHARFFRRTEQERKAYATQCEFDVQRDLLVLTLRAPDYPSLLSVIAGACFTAGANIVGARIHTTTDDMALDTISISRTFKRDPEEVRRAIQIAIAVEQAIKQKSLPKISPGRGEARGRRRASMVEPVIFVNNEWSKDYTVVEVAGPDRPGLLYELTLRLFKLNLNIAAANVATFGERIVDVFYVTDSRDLKIVSTRRHPTIKRALTDLFSARTNSDGSTKAVPAKGA